MLDTKEYLIMRHEGVNNARTIIQTYEHDLNGNWDTTRNTDWQKELIGRTAHISNEHVSVTTGNEYLQALFSLGHNKQTMVFPGKNSLEHFSLHGNLEYNFSQQTFSR